jgi:hypothetical protein
MTQCQIPQYLNHCSEGGGGGSGGDVDNNIKAKII